jgi:hypothetical protein
MKCLLYSFIVALSAILVVVHIDGFQNRSPAAPERPTSIRRNNRNDPNDNNISNPKSGNDYKPKNFLDDLQGMFRNLDDVVDDFVFKRMGAGEQWYGKRKYNPSGRIDGDYNGMGRSDYWRIELAREQKEEMELRKQQRLKEEEGRNREGEQ